MSWFKEYFLFTACIFFVFLTRPTRCEKFVNAREGEAVLLDFSYDCNSSMITLRYANRLPFYTSEDPETLKLHPDQSRRFKVEQRIEGSRCFLLFRIEPVKRHDAGTYILLAYRLGVSSTRIKLHVDFLPGMANCSFGGNHDVQDWGRLHCKASVGSKLGQINCYQAGMMMPHLGAVSENDETLEQTILVMLVEQNHQYVFCCSSQLLEPKGRCDCKDFVWDSLSQKEVHNQRDPCPTSFHNYTASVTEVPTEGELKEYDDQLKSLLIIAAATASTVILLLPFIWLIIAYLLK